MAPGGTEKYLVLQYVPPGLTSGTYFRIASEWLVPSTMSMEQAADTLVFSPAEVGSAVAAEAQLTFVLHVLPLGAATDYTDQGDYTEAAISIAGDAAEVLTGPLALAAKTAEGARRIRRTGIVLEASVGVYRAGQGVTDIYNEKYARGAGELGEALLRLFGVTIHVRSARRPKADLPDAVPITPEAPPTGAEVDEFVDVPENLPGSRAVPAPARIVDSIPSVRNGEFNRWFNKLSADELDEIWKNPKLRDAIEDRLRHPGGLHEWHLVSRTPTFKRWGLTADQIKDMRSLIKDTKFVNPVGRHGGKGSTTAHNELLGIIDSSLNYETFVRRLQTWAHYRLKGGASALPPGLRP